MIQVKTQLLPAGMHWAVAHVLIVRCVENMDLRSSMIELDLVVRRQRGQMECLSLETQKLEIEPAYIMIAQTSKHQNCCIHITKERGEHELER